MIVLVLDVPNQAGNIALTREMQLILWIREKIPPMILHLAHLHRYMPLTKRDDMDCERSDRTAGEPAKNR